MTRSLLLAALMTAGSVVTSADRLLFCTDNEDSRGECRRLRVIPPLNADCDVVGAADDCLEFHCVIAEDCELEVREGRADVLMASALGLWYMAQDYGDTPQAFAPVVRESRGINDISVTREDGLTYKAVAIATNAICEKHAPLTLRSAKNLRSCHGEYGDLAGWVVPVSSLLSKGLAIDDTGDDIDIVTTYFSSSCAPSNNPAEGEVCTACDSAQEDYAAACDLDDRYAGPLGVLTCLREDAADIGFVDHWTAWGAGQTGNSAEANATLRNMGEFKAVCTDGCRDLQDAVEEACYLSQIPSDVAVMRASDGRIQTVRNALVAASSTAHFRESFATSSNLQGILFSHGTTKLVAVEGDSAQDYLGELNQELTRFSKLFEDSTDLSQPDVGGNKLEKSVTGHPALALGLTFLTALLVGAVIGAIVIIFVFRRKNLALRQRGFGTDNAAYNSKHDRNAPAAALEVPEIGPAGIDRHGPLHSLDL